MAAKTTLNARNLEALGAPALAALLIEISTGSAAAKRRLRLALAGGQGPAEAAAEIRKRLTTIARSRSHIGWKQRKPLANDLHSQMRAILDQVAPADPTLAADLMWQFLGLANPVFDRLDDSSGTVIGIFHDACDHLGQVAESAGLAPDRLADRVLEALLDNGYGQYDGLIDALTPALGAPGLTHLKALLTHLAATPVPVPPKADWVRVGIGMNGPLYAHTLEDRNRISTADIALRQIADAEGDADAFIARIAPQTRRVPAIAADIALRLLTAGRADEALGVLDEAEVDAARLPPTDWQEARLAALDALGRSVEAQQFRWQCFATGLSVDMLRAYLKRLPDFEDIEAEDRAMEMVQQAPDVHRALHFFLHWPAADQAARLVQARHGELDGNYYELLTPAADLLAPRHPLAATLILRAMIDFTLIKGRSSRYGHAARHLAECSALAPQIADLAGAEPHVRYLAGLRATHGKKTSFWTALT